MIEVLIAAALFAIASVAAFELVRATAAQARAFGARRTAYAALERFTAQLRAEARSADAIWIGSADAGDTHDGCVELDFSGADSAGPRFWSYRSFPHHVAGDAVAPDALERQAGNAPAVPCASAAPGAIALSGVRTPVLTAIAPERLSAHRDPESGASDSGYLAGGIPATAPVPLGILDAQRHPVSGGNTVVEVRLATGAAARVVDLLPGTMPNGFVETLRYTCTERCDVGHDTAAAKTLTACEAAWTPAWSEFVRWNDPAAGADGALTFPGGWFIAGTFAFTYRGTRLSDGGVDTFAATYLGTNWDAGRDYAAYPPDRPAPDGSTAGSFAPWDVRVEAAPAWLTDFAPYLAAGERAPLEAEARRCAAVQQQGEAGAFTVNG